MRASGEEKQRERESGEYGGYLVVFAGWQQQPAHTEPTSQPTCIFQSPHAILLLSLLPLSVAALTNFLPHCHSCAICLFGQPPHIQTISAEQLHVHVSLSVFRAIFCIIRIALVIHSSISEMLQDSFTSSRLSQLLDV